MTVTKRTPLSLLCTRAVIVFTEAAPSMSTVRYLSSVGASLSSLSRNTSDALLLRSANASVQRLSSLFPLLHAAEPLAEDAAVNIFRIAKNNGNGNISPACIANLLKEVDERLEGSQFASWKPQTIVASLHAIAIAFPSGGSLSMVHTFLFCVKEHVSRLDERRTARLLWCVAVLRMEVTHAVLWGVLCRRLVRLSKTLTPAGHSLIVEALLIVPECVCDAQQELLCVLHETRLSHRENETLYGEEEVIVRDEYQTLKNCLLSDAHLLPLESIIQMLSRISKESLVSSEEIEYLLQHLLRRPFNPVMCRGLLEFLVINNKSELTQLLCEKAVECIRTEHAQAPSGREDYARDLTTICIAAMLERQQTQTVSVRTRVLLEELIVKCPSTSDGIWDRYSGRNAGVLVVSLDVLTSCCQSSANFASLDGSCKLLEHFPKSWERGGFSSVMVAECAACVCSACDLFRVHSLLETPFSFSSFSASSTSLPMETSLIGNDNRMKGRGSSSRTSSLLQRCTEVFDREGTFLPTSVVFDMWRAAAGVAGEPAVLLKPLMELLLNYTERHPADFSLRDVAKFVGGECHQFPVEAFELFVRCLTNERGNVTASHLDMLIASLEGVAARRGYKALLERMLLMLFLRSLGQEKALIHAVSFSTPQLVRLFHCCSFSSDVTTSMQATLLELIVNSCSCCATMEELNTAASLLPQLQRGSLRDALVWALTVNARRMHPAKTPDVQKALMIVYLQKAGATVEEDFLQTMRRRA